MIEETEADKRNLRIAKVAFMLFDHLPRTPIEKVRQIAEQIVDALEEGD